MMRQPLKTNPRRAAVVKTIARPAPVGGWDAESALASMPKDRAVDLYNWFPRPDSIEVRRGQRLWAGGIGTSSSSVESLMVYNGLTSSKMFAAIATDIYDASANGTASSAVTSLNSGRWQHVNFANSGANYLLCVNGADSLRAYNGTAWSTPSITGIASSDAIHINVHKRRVWLTLNQTTKAAYLATDAIAGAATVFDFGQVFSDGGYLMATATWTRDGGAGSDDVLVAISSRGQAALYSGTDPDSALTWDLVGVFNVGAPIGRRCFVKWGADLILLTVDGAFAMSQILSVDASSRERVALSKRITNAFAAAARSYASNFGWEPIVYPRGTRLIVNVPLVENADVEQYVMNTITGAWCRFGEHHANCWAVFNDLLYYGANDGTVRQADYGAEDADGESVTEITATGQSAYDSHGSPGMTKRFVLAEPLVTAESTNRPSVGISVDFRETYTVTNAPASETLSATWDGGFNWDGGAYWAGDDVAQVNDWLSTTALGKFASLKFRATTGTTIDLSIVTRDQIGIVGRDGNDIGQRVSSSGSDEVMRINGFVLLAEPGGYL